MTNEPKAEVFETFAAALDGAVESLRDQGHDADEIEMDAAEFLQLVQDANR